MKYIKLFENYKETSWTDDDVTITIKEVEDYLKDEEVIEIPVKEIADKCIHKDKKDKKTKDRAEASDLSFPIIITTTKGKYGMILDGHHRLQKAINTEEKTIKAKVLNLDDAPKKYQEMFK